MTPPAEKPPQKQNARCPRRNIWKKCAVFPPSSSSVTGKSNPDIPSGRKKWTFHHLTNASTEGFNNKIRWLIRQAYGFRDREYLKLKIFQLPEISCVKEV
ncbi:MAG: transposase [Lentisphaeria bacterium]|nr:transposase [Lentisphaeria bacterium]